MGAEIITEIIVHGGTRALCVQRVYRHKPVLVWGGGNYEMSEEI